MELQARHSPTDYEELDVSSNVVQLTAAKADRTKRIDVVEVFFSGGPIRVRIDGTDPTAAIGILVYEGTMMRFFNSQMTQLRMIKSDIADAIDGKVRIIYYKLYA